MKYLGIYFTNKYLNKYRDNMDIANNDLLLRKLPYYKETNVVNEAPLWLAYINGIVNQELKIKAVYDINDTINYINDYSPEYLFFSVTEVTKNDIIEIINGIDEGNTTIVLNEGITDFENKSIEIIKTIDELNKKFNLNKDFKPTFSGLPFYTNYLPRIQLSHGCKFNCKFCLIEHNITVRKDIYEQFRMYDDIEYVYIGDATFGQIKDTYILLNSYKKHHKTNHTYIIQTSPKTVLQNIEMLHKWKDVGIEYIELGIESFSPNTLKTLNKPFNTKGINEVLNILNKFGFKVIVNLMLGIKGETSAEYTLTLLMLEEYEDLISHLNITYYSDYESKFEEDRLETNLFKSWHNSNTKKLQLYEFANDIYKFNYKLVNKNYE